MRCLLQSRSSTFLAFASRRLVGGLSATAAGSLHRRGRVWRQGKSALLDRTVNLPEALYLSEAILQDIVKDVRDAAHFTAHVAGMIHTRSAKAWAEQEASRSAEALDQSQNALHEITRVEAWQNSAGPCAGILLMRPTNCAAADRQPRRSPDFL